MTLTQAIDYRNNQKSGRTFKVSKNWIMVKNNSDKRFSDHSSVVIFIENVENEIKTNNSRLNAQKTIEYLVLIGLEIDNKSIFGSTYFYTKKGHIRVSNHHYTSEKYNDPELNLCSYNIDGHLEMIESAKNFLS